MSDVTADKMKTAVEAKYGGTATFVKTVEVTEKFGNKTIWDGDVHVFAITGHPRAKHAYAWSSPIAAHDNCRFFSALHIPPITGPAEAIRAAIAAERRRS